MVLTPGKTYPQHGSELYDENYQDVLQLLYKEVIKRSEVTVPAKHVPTTDLNFLAGTPLYTQCGKIFGVLFLADRQTRDFPISEKETLNHFARLITTHCTILLQSVPPSTFQPNESQIFDLFLQAPVAISIFKGKNHVIEYANELSLKISGKTREIIGKPVLEIIPEVESQGYIALLDMVLVSGKPYETFEAPVILNVKGKEKLYYLNFTYQPLFDETHEKVIGIISIANDVTEQVTARKSTEESEQRLKNVLNQAPNPILILKGKDLILEVANESVFELWNTGPEALGRSFLDILPEMRDQGFPDLMRKVYETGEPYLGFEMPAYFMRGNKKEMHYFNFVYQPYREKDGSITGILIIATDVTDQLMERQKAEASQQNFSNLVMQAPIGIAIIRGKEFIVELANNSFLEIVQRGRTEFVNKPLWETMPEVKDQGFNEILLEVLATGIKFEGKEYEAKIIRNNIEETIYVDFVYEPLKEVNGKNERIMILAIENTDKVIARKKIEVSEKSARLAIEAAELGSFSIDLLTNKLTSSKRLDEIMDMTDQSDRSRYVSAIHPDDLAMREKAYTSAYQTGVLEYEARIIKKDKNVNWIKVKGNVTFDENRKPLKLLGVVQDITEQKLFSEALTRQVKERTLELSITNQKLQVKNKELEQFAFVSSHDLQEPLRKIQMFSGMILEKEGDLMSEFSRTRFQKVIESALRMSNSLRDLLNYASLEKAELLSEVNLNEVVENVETDLELLIAQKSALIETGKLPTLHAIPLQMQQLFYNLLNNALKFSKEGVQPRIYITCRNTDRQVNDEEKSFYEITVRDNGIGFDEASADKMFTIFQRLHDRALYTGTGIGLALCKKVVENHGGHISAGSVPGEGAVFTILLPVS